MDVWLLLGWVLAAVPVYLVVAWSTRWIRKRWARIYARIVLVPPFALVLGMIVSIPLGFLPDDGKWECILCAAQEHQVAFAGVVLRRTPIEAPFSYSKFDQWFLREIDTPHEHDWTAVGCHRRGSMIACHPPDYAGTYFRVLPKLPSPELARGMVSKLIQASPSERRRMLIAMDDEPFRSIVWKSPIPVAELETAFAAWLDDHAEWQ